ncbi:MAG: ABC transporter permease [Oscillospiraceae bacterium]|nr:ABC transporter permease [Oscillospiraceae bacterium]
MSLLVSFLSVGMSVIVSLVVGSTVGYFGGLYDTIVMRILDVFMAIPSMLLSILVAVTLGTGTFNTAVAIAIGGIPALSRTLRSAVLPLRDEEYIEAAKASGAGSLWIIKEHILPNTLAPLIVQISLRLGQSIIVIASLSFVGLGVQPPTPEWGNILASGQSYIRTFWPLITFPGILIGLSMLSFNLLGDGLRDALDPKLK